jgi:uncharacterized protein YjiS (DUF1127 family)
MSTIYSTAGTGRIAAAPWRVSGLVRRCWGALAERFTRERLRTTLDGLSERELMDIGTTRGEIDYVAANRAGDPRGVRSVTTGL